MIDPIKKILTEGESFNNEFKMKLLENAGLINFISAPETG